MGERLFSDLRGYLQQVKALGELVVVEGADWCHELGAITELSTDGRGQKPLLLFDAIKGYPRGYRVLTNILHSVERLSLMLGLPGGLTAHQFIQSWRDLSRQLVTIPPRVVADGPVLEHVHQGQEIDMEEFPVPLWHEEDGGRYIGTADLVITRDPDTGQVNLGTYRVMLQGKDRLGFYISPGKHGRIHRDKYFQRGEPCPVAISFGHDPLLFLLAAIDVPAGVSEYDYAGGILGRPVDVITGPVTGLPIPAAAEIVVEGFAVPGETMPEGPFGEWTGYYASGTRSEPVIRVEQVMHRHQPILCGSPPLPPATGDKVYRSLLRSATIWESLEQAGVPEVTAVRSHEAGNLCLTIVAIRQRYPGHAKQAAAVAAQCRGGAYMGRYIIVVDHDVNIYDNNELLWALCTRSEPERSIDILRRCWSGPLDAAMPPGEKGFNSRALIDACRPYEWLDQFPAVVGASQALRARVSARWGKDIE